LAILGVVAIGGLAIPLIYPARLQNQLAKEASQEK
jgi:hypothetical protein